ncbi:Putative PUA-like superfamily, SRA-YDG superfamily protein [Septoria linicola]|uniref:PUA-like superfamily, SRA-YDG superfamily protein n=1 Tax=Septoria linicola TaxID=215465 RepID=A0A9Q9AYX2_9PEZI|nr:putative PUA-like superfamily, SRA-YDG superfamily protein [Septoria linicola]USW53201.1 Putative PUA-like superfamily, SRA-YDG superfamily protein [Septoria linicola]
MGDKQMESSAEPLLSDLALSVQAGFRELDELWKDQPRWVAEDKRLSVLEAALAEQQASGSTKRQPSRHLSSDESAGHSGSDDAKQQALERQRQKQRQLVEKHRKAVLQPRKANPSTATFNTLEGWNPRKAPRLKSFDKASDARRGSVSSLGEHSEHGNREPQREVSKAHHTISAQPPPSAKPAASTPSLPLKPEPRKTLDRHPARPSFSGRDLSSIKPSKKPREETSSNSSSPKSPISSSTGRGPPEWYTKLKVSNKRSAETSNADTLLQRLRDQVATLKKAGPRVNSQMEMNELREMLHEAPFLAMGPAGPQLLRNKRMLHNEDGLPQIFDDQFAGSMKGAWPWDVQSDAAELYHKWCAKNFDDDMLFGLELAQKGKYADDDRAADTVKKECKVSSKYKGNGKLVNGQWWPTLLCALRDGAHGDSQAGISGDAGVGAYSCFMSGGKNHVYPDKDQGDVVEYFGQDTTNPGQISRGTLLLMKNKEDNIPVRFIRSSKASSHSKYAPQLGFRYDGLYDVTDYELVDKVKERYRFRLVRQAGQGPIRGGVGPEARPTRQEVERFKQDKRFRGIGKAD